MEPGELENQTAIREVFEETGQRIDLEPPFREVIAFRMDDLPRYKQVAFFLAQGRATPPGAQPRGALRHRLGALAAGAGVDSLSQGSGACSSARSSSWGGSPSSPRLTNASLERRASPCIDAPYPGCCACC